MGFLDRFLGKKQERAATQADRARQRDLHGSVVAQTADEQQATRSRMEAELAAQHEQRAAAKPKE